MAKKYWLQARTPGEGGGGNFINPAHITIKFDTVINMGEGFEINLFEGVTHFSPGPPQPPATTRLTHISRRSVRHTKIAVVK